MARFGLLAALFSISDGAGEEREQKEIKGAGMHLTFMLLLSRGIVIYHEPVSLSNLQRTPYQYVLHIARIEIAY